MDEWKGEPSRKRTYKWAREKIKKKEQRDKKGRKKKREVNPGSKEAWKLKNTGWTMNKATFSAGDVRGGTRPAPSPYMTVVLSTPETHIHTTLHIRSEPPPSTCLDGPAAGYGRINGLRGKKQIGLATWWGCYIGWQMYFGGRRSLGTADGRPNGRIPRWSCENKEPCEKKRRKRG